MLLCRHIFTFWIYDIYSGNIISIAYCIVEIELYGMCFVMLNEVLEE